MGRRAGGADGGCHDAGDAGGAAVSVGSSFDAESAAKCGRARRAAARGSRLAGVRSGCGAVSGRRAQPQEKAGAFMGEGGGRRGRGGEGEGEARRRKARGAGDGVGGDRGEGAAGGEGGALGLAELSSGRGPRGRA
ncbi:hypothetical protein FGB62_349g01 [Gracilaria domingensis]|nr:hypothetical protein FGB62_349g01 [Gracilaria domingensis]